MSERVGTPSPRALARWAGLFELLEGQASSWGQVFILLGIALAGLAAVFHIVWIWLMCIVLRPVSRTGSLIARSTFLPRIIGVLLVVDGIGWMLFLEPRLASRLFPFIATASGLAEVPLTLWLLGRGLNSERWHAQAASALRATPIV